MGIAILRLVALASLAVIGASFGAQPAAALSVESHNFVRHDHAARHGILAKRQTATPSNRKRCKARPSSTLSASSANPTSPASSSKPPTVISSKPPQQQPSKPASTPAAPKPTSTKVSTPSPTPPPSTGGGGSGVRGKRCFGWVGNIDPPTFIGSSKQISRIYNWCPYKDGQMVKRLQGGTIFTPMFWGAKQAGDLKQVVPGYSDFILGFNEPNQAGQAYMSPQDGAGLWKQYMDPLARQGYRTVSPAPTNAPSGATWLQEFFAACSTCHIDHVGAHFYGTDVNALIAHVDNYHKLFNRDVWITEYACNDFSRGTVCSSQQVRSFMQRSMDYFDSQPWVHTYCWFGVLQMGNMGGVHQNNQLVNPGTSTPNDLGRLFLGY